MCTNCCNVRIVAEGLQCTEGVADCTQDRKGRAGAKGRCCAQVNRTPGNAADKDPEA